MIVIWRDLFTIAIVATQLDNGMSVEIHGFQHAQKAFETIQISGCDVTSMSTTDENICYRPDDRVRP